jgi:hypothetical protein
MTFPVSGRASGGRVMSDRPRLFNKTFYNFVFGFVTVIAGVLVFILVIGIVSGVA